MLQTVIRSSMVIARIASPVYSMQWPVPPLVEMRPMSQRMRSLAVTPKCSRPSMRSSSVLGFCCKRVCVASTCSTSLVPMPKAKAPTAPWVAVWLSPQTIVIPGWVSPNSGPITCTIPWLASSRS